MKLAGHRPRVIAVSGVDGSGKSSLVRGLMSELEAAGERAEVLWFRPGMGMGWLDAPARTVKRLLRQPESPAITRAGTGDAPRTRQGVLGYAWCLVVTAVYVRHVTGALRRAKGVVVCDRYVLDALVTLRVFYAGVDVALAERIVRARLPEPEVTFYLDVPAEVAVARKPLDMIGEPAVRAQLEAYAAELPAHPQIVVLDGTAEPEELVSAAWSTVRQALAGDAAQS